MPVLQSFRFCFTPHAHLKLGQCRDMLQVLHKILSEFYIPGVRKMVTQLKKSCPGCLRLNKKSFFSYAADMPDVLKSIQTPISYTQADIFGPIFVYNNDIQLKRWVLVNLCLTSRAVHLEVLHSYTALSMTRGFRRTFALRGTPGINTGLNIVKSGKNLTQSKIKVVSVLNIKFAAIEFRATLPKHHKGLELLRE